jgi:hypothetical protein
MGDVGAAGRRPAAAVHRPAGRLRHGTGQAGLSRLCGAEARATGNPAKARIDATRENLLDAGRRGDPVAVEQLARAYAAAIHRAMMLHLLRRAQAAWRRAQVRSLPARAANRRGGS